MAEDAEPGPVDPVIDLDNDPDVVRFSPERSGPSIADAIDPATATGSGSGPGGSGTGKRRGRKPGSKNGTKAAKTAQIDLTGIEKILFSAHITLAAIARTPELAIDKDEAEQLAKAATEVSKHYMNLEASEKTISWINLGLCLGTIYGPRFVAVRITRRNRRYTQTGAQGQQAPQPAPESGNVVVFPPGSFPDAHERGTG